MVLGVIAGAVTELGAVVAAFRQIKVNETGVDELADPLTGAIVDR